MAQPRLIAIDMDGTLLNSHGSISARNAAALQLAEQAGAEVVIATGRRHAYAMRVLRGLNLRAASAVISSNGTVVRTIANDLLHRTHLPLETALWLCSHLNDFRNTLVATFDAVDAEGEEQRGALVCERLDDLHASIDAWMQSNWRYLAYVPSMEDALLAGETPPIQMMVCGGIARMSAAEARLLEDSRVTAVDAGDRPGTEIALHRTIYPDSDLSIVDILPAGCSKASALGYLAARRGIRTDEILAIGDNWNDAPMLRLAGRAVLMSNAPRDLQAVAHSSGWQIAPSNDEDGVAATIESALTLTAANA
jgi:hydroxymethylpyrimidine pyrophosphatase-like HAD family hydrolase